MLVVVEFIIEIFFNFEIVQVIDGLMLNVQGFVQNYGFLVFGISNVIVQVLRGFELFNVKSFVYDFVIVSNRIYVYLEYNML